MHCDQADDTGFLFVFLNHHCGIEKGGSHGTYAGEGTPYCQIQANPEKTKKRKAERIVPFSFSGTRAK
jgi:hypothetical protein